MLKAIALSLAFLLSFGVVVPLMTDHSEAAAKSKKKKKRKKIKKYSRAWWRIYRAKQKRKRALNARKCALKARQDKLAGIEPKEKEAPELALSNDASGQPTKAVVKVSKPAKNTRTVAVAEYSQPNVLPTGEHAPTGWKRNGASAADVQFKVSDNGMEVGSADLKIVAPAMGGDDPGPRGKTVGGVTTNALRRTVIDRMLKEQGWIVNDYQKDVNGKKVYVVVAQSQTPGSGMQSRVFYFMEADGRVYSLATSAPVERSEKLAQDSEKVLNSLNRANRPLQASAGAEASTLR